MSATDDRAARTFVRPLFTALIVFLAPALVIAWAVNNAGLSIITTVVPTYHAAVILAVALPGSVMLWFALSAARTAEASASRLRVAEELAWAQAAATNRRMDEFMQSVDMDADPEARPEIEAERSRPGEEPSGS